MNWLLTDKKYDRLNPPPVSFVADENGKPYVEFLNDDAWLWMGYIPTPKTKAGWFFHHIMHGLMMRYPFHKVVLYALSNMSGEADRIEVVNE